MILIPVLGDQLSLTNPALRDVDKNDCIVVMAEVLEESQHVWSTRMRSAVFLSAMRHFAQELIAAGWRVEYHALGTHSFDSLTAAWQAAIKKHKPALLRVCEPGDWRVEQMIKASATNAEIPLQLLLDDHFLISRPEFAQWAGKSKFLRMEMFYRLMRKRLNVLMQADGEPEAGQWNFDEDNRSSFGKKGPQDLPIAKRFTPDKITKQVIKDLNTHIPDQPGQSDAFDWPVTRMQALEALDNFIEQRLARFGPTQDAMWAGEPFLFHSLISVGLNLKLINPREVIQRAVEAYQQGRADIASVEGFIRQILGWREFMRGVYWLDMPAMKEANHFGFTRNLPKWYWTGKTDMQCMRDAIGQTLKHGYAHHIQRLMVTGNFGLLAGIEPQQVCDWYLAVYVDAIEWVELPNTAGMALFANGGRFTTKPYIASGAYIKRMSNYCTGCKYDPATRVGDTACPVTTLYWAFLDTHAKQMNANPRAALMMKNYQRLSVDEVAAIRVQAADTLLRLDDL